MQFEGEIQYTKKSAGQLISDHVPVISPDITVAEVRQLLSKKIDDFSSIDYFYVVNHRNKLVGVLSIKDILRLSPTTIIRKAMITDVVTARSHTSQEHVALLALKYNLKAIPVVDKEDTFLGVVTSDATLKIMSDELTEDILHLAGINKSGLAASAILHSSLFTLVKARLPWLIVGLGGGILAAQVVGFFEALLAQEVLLVLFLPIMVYMSDAVGGQTQTIFIRAMATVDHFNMSRYLLRELLSGVVLAGILGSALFIIVLLWQKTSLFALILGIALFFTIITAVAIALFVPLILRYFKKDPAVGSGPFATIMRDVLSILIYFGIANLLLGLFSTI